MSRAVVRIEHLELVFYTDGVETVIHRDLNLRIQQGEVLSIVGGSGSGKTVLLRQILGLEQPAQGRVTVLGQLVEIVQLLDVHRRGGLGMEDGRQS